MMVINYGSIISPGNEQKNYWICYGGSKSKSKLYGSKNPVIDEIIDKLISSKSRRARHIY